MLLEPTVTPHSTRTCVQASFAQPSTHLVHLQGCRQQLLHVFRGSSYLPTPPPGPVARPSLEGHALHRAHHDGALRGHSSSLKHAQSAVSTMDTYYMQAVEVPTLLGLSVQWWAG